MIPLKLHRLFYRKPELVEKNGKRQPHDLHSRYNIDHIHGAYHMHRYNTGVSQETC